jgi:hypothetical protein
VFFNFWFNPFPATSNISMLPFALTYLFPSNPLSRFPQGGKAGSFPPGGRLGSGLLVICFPATSNISMLPFALTYLFPSNPLSRFPQGEKLAPSPLGEGWEGGSPRGKSWLLPPWGKVGKGVACNMFPGNIKHINVTFRTNLPFSI